MNQDILHGICCIFLVGVLVSAILTNLFGGVWFIVTMLFTTAVILVALVGIADLLYKMWGDE